MSNNKFFKTEDNITKLRFTSENELSKGIAKVPDNYDGIAADRIVHQSDKITVLTQDDEKVPFEAHTNGKILVISVATHWLDDNPDKVYISKKEE